MDVGLYVITGVYSMLIIGFLFGTFKLKSFHLSKNAPTEKFSILIPFRNEAGNLDALLNSITSLNYPKDYFEVILIDDFSSDNSLEIIETFRKNHPELNVKIIQNTRSSSPKKTAISLGIQEAKFDWILTTDADCQVPSFWLNAFDQKIQKTEGKMICGPVKLMPNKSYHSTFEILNFNSLQASTMGSFGWKNPILCNGANMCYSKEKFFEVDGYQGNDKIASGDDIFLLEKFKRKNPKSVHFLKSRDAIVLTNTQNTLADFISQQQRWTAKSKFYTSNFTKMVGFIVFTQNFSLILFLLLGFYKPLYFEIFHNCLAIKIIVDTLLMYQSLKFYKQKKLAFASLPLGLVYPFFSVAMVVLSFFGKYQWKKRTFKS